MKGFILLLFVLFSSRYGASQTLDPNEVEALQIFATRLGITHWNFSVDPCSGQNGWNDTKAADNFQPSSGVECECPANSSFCHVTKLVVFNMNVGGQIAPEVGNFSSLFNMNLGQNVITGTLPEEIGSLSRMQYLNVGQNRLTGPLPASIGKLLQLVSLGIGTNYFTGNLPKEIGNLRVMTQMYMDSSGLSGKFPSEFGNLQNLGTLWMSDNAFNGTIDFLGNLTSLKDLRMEGNNFEGTFPSSLGRLQKLETLFIGDLSAGGRLPDTVNLLKTLSILSLRNCELSGPIPVLSNLTRLTHLDLSFNNFTGPIPSSLGSLEALETLLLANNGLTGTLPPELESLRSLLRLDLSFNNLSGALPSWVNRNQLQKNMIGNKFNISTLAGPNAEERSCLEGGSNCERIDDGRNFELNINCGGSEQVISGVRYFGDSSPLNESTYYSNSTQSWAVSSTGYAVYNQNNRFITTPTTNNRISGTVDTSLYSTARASPGSLKYFGLGLFNGRYQVDLHFAEIVIADNSSGWTSLGRRFFDVYVQGRRVWQDFDIRTEARGSFRALVKNVTGVQVSTNVLEVHLLWRGKGTCCSPAPNSFGPLVSAIRVIPMFDTTGLRPRISSSSSKSSRGIGIGLGVGVPVVILFLVIVIVVWFLRKRRFGVDEEELKSLEAGKPNLYSYSDMKLATHNFAPDNKLGQGGFGSVYKGVLHDGTVVAIKELSSKSHQGTREFLNEVTVISAVQHRNLVKLHGCCIEGSHRLLIYEFLENNSLHHALLSPKGTRLQIDWPTRFNICVGIARGIAYLHEESLPRIIHRDIKASNVLLDKTLTPKIADFGLAKLFDDQQTHISTRVAGTIGYLAPEYAMRGQLTEKADVYSFGVLALELVCGRENLDSTLPSDKVYLLEWAWELYEKHRTLEIVDKGLSDFSEEDVLRVIQVALLCSQAAAAARPRMSLVVAMLTGTAPINVSSLQPGYFAALQNAAPGFYFEAALSKKSPPRAVSDDQEITLSSSVTSSNSNFSLREPR